MSTPGSRGPLLGLSARTTMRVASTLSTIPSRVGNDRHAGIARHHPLHAGADQRRFGAQQRHRLALHVRAHERAVGVVVLEERDQRGGDAHQLVRRHVHEVDFFGRHHDELTAAACRDAVGGEAAARIDGRVGLGDDVLLLFERGEIAHPLGHAAVLDLAVGGLDEAELVDAGVGRQRRDQADVRTFRRFDRADPAVVGRMDVAHLEAGALAGQTARSERREPPLVGDLRQRVGLVHELRELAGAEELLDHRGDRLVVDQLLRHQRFDVLQAHALLDGALHADQADAVLVLDQLADRAHAAVAEVVDVVGLTVAVLQLDQVAHDLQDVLAPQRALLERRVEAEAVVELQAADAGEIVALGVEEQVVEERGRASRSSADRRDAAACRSR